MNTYSDKITETKTNAAANDVAALQNTAHQLTDNRPETISQRKIQETANNSQQVKQLRELQKMVNNSGQANRARNVSSTKTVQGYFFLGVKKTNDKAEFPDNDAVWELIKAEFVSLGMESTFLETLKVPIMQWARARGKYSFEKVKTYLDGLGLSASKAKGEKPISETSPTGMSSLTPELMGSGERVKHSTVAYTFNNAAVEGGKEKATFDLDKYTKKGGSDLTAGAWNKEIILMAIRFWSMKAPLVQHLAQFVLPKLTRADRKWEMYLREMERVLKERTTEAMNREFSMQAKVGDKTVDFERKPIEQKARKKVQEALLAGTAPPGGQDEIYFIDDLIREKLDAADAKDWYSTPAGTQLKFNTRKTKTNPGMTLVHWRTILLFDWQAGHEVYKNGR